MDASLAIRALDERIISCNKCPRLSSYIRQVSMEKVRRFSDQSYWGRPLPGFGDAEARLLLVGLAPAAHGGNRTGRMFTGDSSGDWVARALYEHGFANSPHSVRADDGLRLQDAYVTAAVRCAPPANRPIRSEFENCSQYLADELTLLCNVQVIVCLGYLAFDACRRLLGTGKRSFAHGARFRHDPYTVLCSYHPSRQNTQTGRLTWNQWSRIFKMARTLLDSSEAYSERSDLK